MSAENRSGPGRQPARIAPSILAADFARLGEQVEMVEKAGADWIHVDVMDGHFVPNITIGPFVAKAVAGVTKLPLDVHLMIEKPERYIDDFVAAGASRVGVHAETCPNLHRTIGQIHDAGARACVVLNPGTSPHAIEMVLGDVDQVLVMTVNPGFGGQSFIESQLPKIETLRRWIDDAGLAVDLQVDGGIGEDNIARVAAAGADAFVAGTAVFKAPDPAKAIATLRERADATLDANRE